MAFGDDSLVSRRGRGSNNNRGGSNNKGGGGGGGSNKNNRPNNKNKNKGPGGGGPPDPLGGGGFGPAAGGSGNPFATLPFGGGPLPSPASQTAPAPTPAPGPGAIPFPDPAPSPFANPVANPIPDTSPFAAESSAPPPALPGGAVPGGPGSIFTDEAIQGSSGELDNYRGAAWGLLNQGGIAQDPIFGSAGSDWLDRQIEDWYSQWSGLENVAGADRPDWHNYVLGIPGGAPPGTTPPLDWLRQTWGPQMGQYLGARFGAQTPRNRGYDSTRFTSPRRVVQF